MKKNAETKKSRELPENVLREIQGGFFHTDDVRSPSMTMDRRSK